MMDKELLYKAFHASPDAILISRLKDGHFVEVNDGFTRLFGFSRDEALSNTSMQLGVWINPGKREDLIAALRKKHRIQDYEADFRTKSGKIINCLVSGEVIQLKGEAHGLWVVRDITERMQVDKILHLRLNLWDYATTHTLIELMQKALDEIEALTGSQIGFYHFVDEDQNNLSLQAWSTRTLADFCKTEGAGLHYPIESAGVWVDCVHQHKPVIHNDYAALPHRKGLPEGHAVVLRELVAPTIRNGKVVSILGVGNKPSNYDQEDIGLVSYISDLVWQIVEQKRYDEQIRLLNVQFKYLAMIDELTGLTNRRSFFMQGATEIKRTQRFNQPLSLLMLDVDSFKTINDRYGHEVGDQVLQRISNTLSANVREIDTVARMGGEEFSVLLPNTTPEDGVILAERLRSAVENTRYPILDPSMKVTLSIGVYGCVSDCEDIDTMLRNADSAMYQAKNEGRNRVVMFKRAGP
jgi:diguanylate cyclase (GGDEF)-like protein/PAS domain S-box-containing protein